MSEVAPADAATPSPAEESKAAEEEVDPADNHSKKTKKKKKKATRRYFFYSGSKAPTPAPDVDPLSASNPLADEAAEETKAEPPADVPQTKAAKKKRYFFSRPSKTTTHKGNERLADAADDEQAAAHEHSYFFHFRRHPAGASDGSSAGPEDDGQAPSVDDVVAHALDELEATDEDGLSPPRIGGKKRTVEGQARRDGQRNPLKEYTIYTCQTNPDLRPPSPFEVLVSNLRLRLDAPPKTAVRVVFELGFTLWNSGELERDGDDYVLLTPRVFPLFHDKQRLEVRVYAASSTTDNEIAFFVIEPVVENRKTENAIDVDVLSSGFVLKDGESVRDVEAKLAAEEKEAAEKGQSTHTKIGTFSVSAVLLPCAHVITSRYAEASPEMKLARREARFKGVLHRGKRNDGGNPTQQAVFPKDRDKLRHMIEKLMEYRERNSSIIHVQTMNMLEWAQANVNEPGVVGVLDLLQETTALPTNMLSDKRFEHVLYSEPKVTVPHVHSSIAPTAFAGVPFGSFRPFVLLLEQGPVVLCAPTLRDFHKWTYALSVAVAGKSYEEIPSFHRTNLLPDGCTVEGWLAVPEDLVQAFSPFVWPMAAMGREDSSGTIHAHNQPHVSAKRRTSLRPDSPADDAAQPPVERLNKAYFVLTLTSGVGTARLTSHRNSRAPVCADIPLTPKAEILRVDHLLPSTGMFLDVEVVSVTDIETKADLTQQAGFELRLTSSGTCVAFSLEGQSEEASRSAKQLMRFGSIDELETDLFGSADLYDRPETPSITEMDLDDPPVGCLCGLFRRPRRLRSSPEELPQSSDQRDSQGPERPSSLPPRLPAFARRRFQGETFSLPINGRQLPPGSECWSLLIDHGWHSRLEEFEGMAMTSSLTGSAEHAGLNNIKIELFSSEADSSRAPTQSTSARALVNPPLNVPEMQLLGEGEMSCKAGHKDGMFEPTLGKTVLRSSRVSTPGEVVAAYQVELRLTPSRTPLHRALWPCVLVGSEDPNHEEHLFVQLAFDQLKFYREAAGGADQSVALRQSSMSPVLTAGYNCVWHAEAVTASCVTAVLTLTTAGVELHEPLDHVLETGAIKPLVVSIAPCPAGKMVDKLAVYRKTYTAMRATRDLSVAWSQEVAARRAKGEDVDNNPSGDDFMDRAVAALKLTRGQLVEAKDELDRCLSAGDPAHIMSAFDHFSRALVLVNALVAADFVPEWRQHSSLEQFIEETLQRSCLGALRADSPVADRLAAIPTMMNQLDDWIAEVWLTFPMQDQGVIDRHINYFVQEVFVTVVATLTGCGIIDDASFAAATLSDMLQLTIFVNNHQQLFKRLCDVHGLDTNLNLRTNLPSSASHLNLTMSLELEPFLRSDVLADRLRLRIQHEIRRVVSALCVGFFGGKERRAVGRHDSVLVATAAEKEEELTLAARIDAYASKCRPTLDGRYLTAAPEDLMSFLNTYVDSLAEHESFLQMALVASGTAFAYLAQAYRTHLDELIRAWERRDPELSLQVDSRAHAVITSLCSIISDALRVTTSFLYDFVEKFSDRLTWLQPGEFDLISTLFYDIKQDAGNLLAAMAVRTLSFSAATESGAEVDESQASMLDNRTGLIAMLDGPSEPDGLVQFATGESGELTFMSFVDEVQADVLQGALPSMEELLGSDAEMALVHTRACIADGVYLALIRRLTSWCHKQKRHTLTANDLQAVGDFLRSTLDALDAATQQAGLPTSCHATTLRAAVDVLGTSTVIEQPMVTIQQVASSALALWLIKWQAQSRCDLAEFGANEIVTAARAALDDLHSRKSNPGNAERRFCNLPQVRHSVADRDDSPHDSKALARFALEQQMLLENTMAWAASRDKPAFTLHVVVVAAVDLLDTDASTKTDPYVVLEVGGQREKTIVRKDTCHPVWKQAFDFDVGNLFQEELRVEVLDFNGTMLEMYADDDKIGLLVLPIAALRIGEEVDEWYDLQVGKGDVRLKTMLKRRNA